MDEFDALIEDAISGIAGVFRNIYNHRRDELHKPSPERTYLLHGVALIGVRAVLGVENVTGSPFNVQRSVHIPNLTSDEVKGMFNWYERDSGQKIEQDVIDRLFYEFRGQPGLTCWMGELLTETYNKSNPSITMDDFDFAYSAAINILPNNNILNIISKAKQEPYKQLLFDLFRTSKPLPFKYDDPNTSFLYMNGVIDWELAENGKRYIKFPCPFVQKRLFNYFAGEVFPNVGKLYEPFEDLSEAITENSLTLKNLLRRYEVYLKQNRDWLLRDAPRRKHDLRIYEAVYHFNLYMYLADFLQYYESSVYPEFPTGNGKIDLIIDHAGERYGLEVKSYTNQLGYRKALKQAARYGKQLGLDEICLAFFVEYVDDANRTKYEVLYQDVETGVSVQVVFVETGRE